MHNLSNNAHDAYRRVELDARIEASAGADLTRICLEEALAAVGQALLALAREPGRAPGPPLSRTHAILLWLTRSIAPDNPMRDQLRQFYGGLAATVVRSMRAPSPGDLAQVQEDLTDLLAAAV